MSAKDGRGVKTRGYTRRSRRDSTKRVGGKKVFPYVKVKVGSKSVYAEFNYGIVRVA